MKAPPPLYLWRRFFELEAAKDAEAMLDADCEGATFEQAAPAPERRFGFEMLLDMLELLATFACELSLLLLLWLLLDCCRLDWWLDEAASTKP